MELHSKLVFLYLTEMDPSLELKYRSKKSREKEMEPERVEKRSSAPDFKLDKRRGSKVSVHSFYLSYFPIFIFLMSVSKVAYVFEMLVKYPC